MRSKKFRKYLHWFQLNFGYGVPYKIIVDEEFVRWADKMKMEAFRLLCKIMGGFVKLYVTKCTKKALKDHSMSDYFQKDLIDLDCGHNQSIECQKCIEDILKLHDGEYCVACQNETFRKYLGNVGGIPLIYIAINVMMLEPPSKASYARVQKRQDINTSTPRDVLEKAREMHNELKPKKGQKYNAAITYIKNQNKKAKGPNPLSVKKKQIKPQMQNQTPVGEKKKRKRKRKSKKLNEEESQQDTLEENGPPPSKRRKISNTTSQTNESNDESVEKDT